MESLFADMKDLIAVIIQLSIRLVINECSRDRGGNIRLSPRAV